MEVGKVIINKKQKMNEMDWKKKNGKEEMEKNKKREKENQ